MAPTSRITMIRRSVPKGGVDAAPEGRRHDRRTVARRGVGVAAVGPGRQGELLESEGRIVGAE